MAKNSCTKHEKKRPIACTISLSLRRDTEQMFFVCSSENSEVNKVVSIITNRNVYCSKKEDQKRPLLISKLHFFQ